MYFSGYSSQFSLMIINNFTVSYTEITEQLSQLEELMCTRNLLVLAVNVTVGLSMDREQLFGAEVPGNILS